MSTQSSLTRWTVATLVAILMLAGLTAGVRWICQQRSLAVHCKAVQADIQRDGAVVTLGGGGQRVAILGDSWAHGDVIENRANGWAHLLATGRTIQLDAIGATGFVNGGFCGGQEYAARIHEVLDARPDVLIIQGGLNDDSVDPQEVQAAAEHLIDAADGVVHRIILIGPVDVPACTHERDIDAALDRAATSHDAEYVSTLDWPVEIGPDGMHMTENGHREYAQMVESILLS